MCAATQQLAETRQGQAEGFLIAFRATSRSSPEDLSIRRLTLAYSAALVSSAHRPLPADVQAPVRMALPTYSTASPTLA